MPLQEFRSVKSFGEQTFCIYKLSGGHSKAEICKTGRGRLTNGWHTDFPSLKHIHHLAATSPLTLNFFLLSLFIYFLSHTLPLLGCYSTLWPFSLSQQSVLGFLVRTVHYVLPKAPAAESVIGSVSTRRSKYESQALFLPSLARGQAFKEAFRIIGFLLAAPSLCPI